MGESTSPAEASLEGDQHGLAARPQVQTRSGAVCGYLAGPISVFKGVPYGTDTGGVSRWRPATPPGPWSGLRDTLAQGPMCPQVFGAPLAEETAMLQRGPMGEDCLTLNVWTPAVGAGSRPVMVWFHGGGFGSGSGGAAPYDGRNLCAKNDVVLVTVTHRLNLFGFLDLEALFGPDYADSGNVGMLDCVAALTWVRDEIAAFGGDPSNVTIFGQSGGAAKVAVLMAMPLAQGLFHRAIAQSGAAQGMGVVTRTQASGAAALLVKHLGVGSIGELEATPAPRLIQAMVEERLRFGPVLDNRILCKRWLDPAAPGGNRSTPLLCGATRHEATFFPGTPLDPIDEPELRQRLRTRFSRAAEPHIDAVIQAARLDAPDASEVALFQLIASMAFAATVIAQAEGRASRGEAPAFVYSFARAAAAQGGRLGATHTVELPYVFDNLAEAEPLVGPATPQMQALAERISACWARFARTGDPNGPGAPPWPPFDLERRATLVIEENLAVVDDPMGRTRLALAALPA